MSDAIDCVVVGAGVVGLAVARQLAMSGLEVVVLDSESQIGMHTSSRNSEVIHAGIYYPEGSLKGQLCVQGKHALYQYCREKRVPHRNLGKLIIATQTSEEATLAGIVDKASANGVDDLQWLSRDNVQAISAELRATAGLLSPSTGIIDSHALMLSYQGDLEAAGGMVLLHQRVQRIVAEDSAFAVCVEGSSDVDVRCKMLINSAGLWAPKLARSIEGYDAALAPEAFFAIGHYFAYAGPSPFSHLVYPVPIPGGLGIHATNDIAGSCRFGPDAEWIDDVDYTFEAQRKPGFIEAIRRYFPGVDPGKLSPAYTGIRPKLYAAGQPAADFDIQDAATHGLPGLVNLFGIESPGLTSSLAIADQVSGRLLA